MLSGRGLCDELITRPEESYRLWCVVVCDLETSRICAPYIYIYIYDISSLRVKRMHEKRLPKLIMEWIPGERRKRERPRKTWMEGVRAAMKTRHLEDHWLNRKEWRLGSGRRRQLSRDRKDR